MSRKRRKGTPDLRRRRRILWFFGIWIGLSFIVAVALGLMKYSQRSHRAVHPKQLVPVTAPQRQGASKGESHPIMAA